MIACRMVGRPTKGFGFGVQVVLCWHCSIGACELLLCLIYLVQDSGACRVKVASVT